MIGVKATRLWHPLGTIAHTATCLSGSVGKARLAFACGSDPGSAESGVGRCVERYISACWGTLFVLEESIHLLFIQIITRNGKRAKSRHMIHVSKLRFIMPL